MEMYAKMIAIKFEEIKMKFLEIEIDEDLFKKLIIASLILIFLYVTFTLISYSMLKPYTLESETVVNSESIKNGVSLLHQGSKRLEIIGWAYKEGQSIETFESYFVLKNRESEKMHIMKTQMEIVEELSVVDELYDCSKSGMHAQSLMFGLKKGIYDICILYKNNSEDILVETGQSITIE